MEDDLLYIKVENNSLKVYPPVQHGLLTGKLYNKETIYYSSLIAGNQLMAYPPEHVNSFLKEFGVVADYIDPNFVYGFFDEVTGTWSGMMEHVNNKTSYLESDKNGFHRLSMTKLFWQSEIFILMKNVVRLRHV